MKKNNYFNELREVFKNDPYRDRFLQELQDHAHDLESELPSSKKLTLVDMQKKFGEPEQIKKTFTQITKPWQRWLELGGAFLLGLLNLTFIYLSSSVANLLVGALGVAFNGMAFQFLLIPIRFIVVSFLWFIVYYCSSRYFLSLSSSFVLSKKVSFSFFFGPSVLLAIVLSSVALITQEWFLLVFSRSLFASTIVGFVALKISFKKPIKQRGGSWFNSKIWLHFLGLIFVLYLITPSIVDLFDPFFISNSGLSLVFLPLFIVEFGLPLFFSLFFGHLPFVIYFIIFCYLFVAIYSLSQLLLKRRFSWVYFGLIVYVFLSFILPHDRFNQSTSIKFPFVEISEVIERQYFGPFYSFYERLTHDELPIFRYEVTFEEGEFILNQNNRWAHRLNPNQYTLSLQDGSELIKFKKQWVETEFELDLELPASVELEGGFECLKKSMSYACDSISFQGKAISNRPIRTYAFSDDLNWLMFSTGGWDDSDQVYLVDLRQINSPS